MRNDYKNWLAERNYQENTQTAQLHRVKKVEEYYGDMDEHYAHGTFDEIIDSLQYSMDDERRNKANPSKIIFDGNIRKNLQSYKSAIMLYRAFLEDGGSDSKIPQSFLEDSAISTNISATEDKQQKLSLERDMQAALRRNILSLEPGLKIIDEGIERGVESGFIDITCDDGDCLVAVELKAGKADSRAIGQILGYMGDLIKEEGGRKVRGILVAHDFDQRAKSAAMAVPALSLKKYSIEFNFLPVDNQV